MDGYRRLKVSRKLMAGLTILAASVQLSVQGQTTGGDACSGNMQLRCEQAAHLKAVADDYVRQAKSFHVMAEKQILEAQKLKGEAQFLTPVTPVKPMKLTPAQAQAASSQYVGDLSQFLQHAQSYNDHMQVFDREMGQCHANEDQYQASLKEYELHLGQFHLANLQMPNVALATGLIRPPHICKAMVLSHGEAAAITGNYLNDQARMLAAEQQLAHAEATLGKAQEGAGLVNAKLETEILRQQREQNLAVEFGRLKEEYDMLVIEKDRIAEINGKGAYPAAKNVSSSVRTKVQGKLTK